MRVTTLFNRLLDLPGTCVTDVVFDDSHSVRVFVRPTAKLVKCPCGQRTRAVYDHRPVRRWRHLDAFAMKVHLAAPVRRIDCRACGRVRTEELPWARPQARHTRQFEDTVAWLAQRTDRTTVSRKMRCSWEAVTAIIARVVQDFLPAARFDDITHIGVDEICYRHPMKYLTIVGDHATSKVVWVGQGRDRAAMQGFFDALGPARTNKIQAVSMDMSPIYRSAVKANAPQADTCFDPYHVISWATRAIDSAASASISDRSLPKPATADWKKTRWALRTGAERNTAEKRALLNDLRRTRRRLYRAWELKEQLRDIYKGDPAQARARLGAWTKAAALSRIPAITALATKVRKHKEGILAAITIGITNGLLEGINSKIRLINARGYGHHSPQALAQMIYLCLGGIEVKLPTKT